MRIGYDASPIRRRRSGIGYYASALLDALAAEFPEDRFLVLSHLGRVGPSRANVVTTQRLAFPIKELWMQLGLRRTLSRARPDLCHFTNSVAPLGLDLPYVVTVHDLSLVRHPEWHPRTRRLWMRRILRPSILGARRVLCDSETTRRDLLDWLPLAESRTAVVPLGVRASFCRTCAPEERDAVLLRYGLSKPYFLYVGNIEPRKNLPALADAFRAGAPDGVELILAGRRAWLWRGVARRLGPLEREGRARRLDYVAEADLPALYQSALALVYPSRMEGFGLPVLEAMASAVPVIASDIEPLASLVGDAGWLAPPDDVAAWASALAEAARDGDRRARLGQRARARAAGFTWERTARETMAQYRAAVS